MAFPPKCEACSWCCFCNYHLPLVTVLLFPWESKREGMLSEWSPL